MHFKTLITIALLAISFNLSCFSASSNIVDGSSERLSFRGAAGRLAATTQTIASISNEKLLVSSTSFSNAAAQVRVIALAVESEAESSKRKAASAGKAAELTAAERGKLVVGSQRYNDLVGAEEGLHKEIGDQVDRFARLMQVSRLLLIEADRLDMVAASTLFNSKTVIPLYRPAFGETGELLREKVRGLAKLLSLEVDRSIVGLQTTSTLLSKF